MRAEVESIRGSVAPDAPTSQASLRPVAKGPEAVSVAQLLLRLPLFAALDKHAAMALSAQCHKQRHARGDLIQHQSARARALLVLLSGRAHSFRTDDRGREVIIDLLRPGDQLGAEGLIDGQPHSASVRCEDDCDLLVIPGGAFAACLASHPALAEAVLSLLVNRLRGAYRRIASLAHHEVGDRLLQRLIDLAEPDGDQLVLRERIARQDLAKMIGASREMVSRTMKELESARTIQVRPDGTIRLFLPAD